MTPSIDCRRYPFPLEAMKAGQVDQHAFGVASALFSIGILYAREPFKAGGGLGVHVSISHCAKGRPRKVTDKVIAVVQKIIEQQGLPWPERYDRDLFSDGPFAGIGVHLWESEDKP